MKILLQPEARNLSNSEIAENYQHLIYLFSKLRGIKHSFDKQSANKKPSYSCN